MRIDHSCDYGSVLQALYQPPHAACSVMEPVARAVRGVSVYAAPHHAQDSVCASSCTHLSPTPQPTALHPQIVDQLTAREGNANAASVHATPAH
jgi:hypothetical protein